MDHMKISTLTTALKTLSDATRTIDRESFRFVKDLALHQEDNEKLKKIVSDYSHTLYVSASNGLNDISRMRMTLDCLEDELIRVRNDASIGLSKEKK